MNPQPITTDARPQAPTRRRPGWALAAALREPEGDRKF